MCKALDAQSLTKEQAAMMYTLFAPRLTGLFADGASTSVTPTWRLTIAEEIVGQVKARQRVAHVFGDIRTGDIMSEDDEDAFAKPR